MRRVPETGGRQQGLYASLCNTVAVAVGGIWAIPLLRVAPGTAATTGRFQYFDADNFVSAFEVSVETPNGTLTLN